MSHEVVTAWIFSLMVSLSPPDKQRCTVAQETPDEAKARYQDIAESIVRQTYDPEIKPAFGGPKGRLQTTLLVTMMFFWESGFRKDVDLGLARGLTSKKGLNDFGRSWCMGQVNLGKKTWWNSETGEKVEDSEKVTADGWSGRDLVSDHNKCVAATIRILRGSIYDCRDLPVEERLAAYISGKCDNKDAAAESRKRMNIVFKKGTKLPNVNDSVVIASLRKAPKLILPASLQKQAPKSPMIIGKIVTNEI
jgi:hypothetical protein